MSFLRLLPFALPLVLLGCGAPADASKTVVRGKLLDNGKPFVVDATKLKLPKGASLPPGTNPLQIQFIPEEPGEMYLTTINDPATGGFELTGSDGRGIKLGKYKVSIQLNTGPGTPDGFGGKYSPEKTPFKVEVKDGEEIVIDVNKPKG